MMRKILLMLYIPLCMESLLWPHLMLLCLRRHLQGGEPEHLMRGGNISWSGACWWEWITLKVEVGAWGRTESVWSSTLRRLPMHCRETKELDKLNEAPALRIDSLNLFCLFEHWSNKRTHTQCILLMHSSKICTDVWWSTAGEAVGVWRRADRGSSVMRRVVTLLSYVEF